MNKEVFVSELKKINIIVTPEMLEKLDKYYKLLVEWNEKINLTRIIQEEDVYLKHFYDSLTLNKAIDLNEKLSLCDVGTGAGFPGIVLKIVFPNLSITLVDSLLKRINFLNLVIKELELDDINAIHTRCEDYARIHREEFDIVTSRAVANLTTLSELCIPLVKVNGFFIPMKANALDEINDASDILKKLESNIEQIIEFDLPMENSHRTIIKIRKNKKSNVKFPRSFDKIKKNR